MEAIIKSPQTTHQHWVHTWAAMPQHGEPTYLPSRPFTLRQTARVSLGATSYIRLRLSNAFGKEPLTIAETTIARSAENASGTNAVQPGTLRHLTFGGDRGARISAGAQIVSDPVDLGFLPPASAVSISLFLPDGLCPAGVTMHPGSRTSSRFTFGNYVSDIRFSGNIVGQADSWYYISGIEVLAPLKSSTFVLIGDSITDGRCSKTNGDTRWPDLLFARLSPSMPSIAFVNQAAGGNCVVDDSPGGPSVLARLDRDVLSISGVRFAMIFEGVNDIGIAPADPKSQETIEKRLIAGYVQVATRLKAAGIVVFIATLTPFGARRGDQDSDTETTPYSHPVRELTRRRVNAWIRDIGPTLFDAVVDFDAVLRDPENFSVLDRQYDSGDRLHPNQRAFQALADFFPLDLFSV